MVSLPSFPSFEERLRGFSFFSEVLPLLKVVPELLFFCLDCEELLPDLVSDFDELDLGLDLWVDDPEVGFPWAISAWCSQ